MSERDFNDLSSLMDGESSELEVRRTLKAMDDNPELLQKWRRYQMVRSIMHEPSSSGAAQTHSQWANVDLTAAVARAIAGEPTPSLLSSEPSSDTDSQPSEPQPSNVNNPPRFLDRIKPLTNVAVAASVTAAVVLSWQTIKQPAQTPSIAASAVSTPAALALLPATPKATNPSTAPETSGVVVAEEYRNAANGYVSVSEGSSGRKRSVINASNFLRMPSAQLQRMEDFLATQPEHAVQPSARR